MLVKAKWSVKDATGWHDAGAVFQTESDLGDAVEVLDVPKRQTTKAQEVKKQEPVKEPEQDTITEPVKEPEKATEAPRSPSRRKKAST